MNAKLNTDNNFSDIYHVACECGCGDSVDFAIERLEDDEYSKGMWSMSNSSNFYSHQIRFIDRVRSAWRMLRGKGFYYYEILLNDNDVRGLKNFLNEYYKEEKE